MKQQEYIRAVLRASGLPRAVRRRLRADLDSDFAARRAQGQSEEQIIAEMGEPTRLAAELREDWAPRPRSGREKAVLALSVVLAVLLGAGLILLLAEQMVLGFFSTAFGADAGTVGVIGGADGPTAIFVTSEPSLLPFLLLALLAAALVVCVLLYRRWRAR